MWWILLCTLFTVVHGDYNCLCNYNVEKSVFPVPSTKGQVEIGYMYEFDCKERLLTQTAASGWVAIAFEHKVGYVQTDGQTDEEKCAGDPPSDDLVTTNQPPITQTTPQPITTTPQPTTTTPQPTTTTPQTTTTTPQPTTTTPQPTTTTPQPTTTTPQPTTTTPQPTTTTPQPTTTTPQPTTTTPQPTTTTPQPTTTTPQPTTTTPQPTTTTPQPTTTTPQPTTTVSIGPYEHVVCPANVIQASLGNGGNIFIDKTNRKCFELIPHARTWAESELNCKHNGGHLVTIKSATQNDLLHAHVQSYGHNVWIGLSDSDQEGKFQWISGDPLTYTNWYGLSRLSWNNIDQVQDCVSMIPQLGSWDDNVCQEQHGYICEYDAVIDQKLTTAPIVYHVTTAPTIHHSLTTTTTTTTAASAPTTVQHLTNAPTVHQSSTVPATVHQTTHVHLVCPDKVLQAAHNNGGYTFIDQTQGKCFELVPHVHTWTDSEHRCNLQGGHLASIHSLSQNDLLYRHVQRYGHPVWIGLNDRVHEDDFHWISGAPLTYAHWYGYSRLQWHHWEEDCVFMRSDSGTWDDDKCSSYHAYICEFDAVPSNGLPTTFSYNYYSDGNTRLCPHSVQSSRHAVGQFDHSCYEINNDKNVSWPHAEQICHKNGGNLVSIESAKEQDFIQSFMKHHYPDHAVWIGLHDLLSEGHFQWISGKPLIYTNWIRHHTDNIYGHDAEDCVLFVPYKNGVWDDVRCGYQHEGGDTGEIHPFLCEYHTQDNTDHHSWGMFGAMPLIG